MSHITYEVRVYNDGDKVWRLNGKYHREDGPAIEFSSGDKSWYLDGERHREDGPAIEYVNGDKSWYLNGKPLTEEEFNARNSSCEGKVVEFEGKRYQLKELK